MFIVVALLKQLWILRVQFRECVQGCIRVHRLDIEIER